MRSCIVCIVRQVSLRSADQGWWGVRKGFDREQVKAGDFLEGLGVDKRGLQ